MAAREVRLEQLLGKVVRDAVGWPAGRIEEVLAEPCGEEYLVSHVLLGPVERIPRLLEFLSQLPTLCALGIGRRRRLRPFPWRWLDLSEPEHPRLVSSKSG